MLPATAKIYLPKTALRVSGGGGGGGGGSKPGLVPTFLLFFLKGKGFEKGNSQCIGLERP